MKNTIGKFPLICSGANLEILDKDECLNDRTKYRMIGMFILLTAVFATLSCGYALYTGFKSVGLSMFVGILWGIFIFNLDRFIISTFRKSDISPDLPLFNKLLLKFGEVLSALPRLLFAVLISIVISAPLELKYFDPEIQAHISSKNFETNVEITNTMQNEFPDIDVLEQENKALQNNLKEIEQKCDRLRVKSFDEAEGISGTGKVGKGPVYREKLAEFDACKKQMKETEQRTQARIDQNEGVLMKLRAERDEKARKRKMENENGNGFLARFIALRELSSRPGPVGWISIFISALFILLETTPIIMKLMSKRSPYDNLLDAEENKSYLAAQVNMSNDNDAANTAIALNIAKNRAMVTTSESLMQETMNNMDDLAPDDIKTAQAEIAKELVARWKTGHDQKNGFHVS